jgi:hypothetical protein
MAFPAAGPGSYVFSDNCLNGESTTVFSGPWSFSSGSCTGPSSVLCPFALIVNLTTPFRYESGKGGLLIDIYASTTTELTFDYAECAGCKYIYSTLGNVNSGSGFGASAAATTKLLTSSELPPVAPPVAEPVAAPVDAPVAAPVESPVAAPQSQAEAPASAPESAPAPVASTAPVASSTPQATTQSPVSTAAPAAVPVSSPKAVSQPVARAPSAGASGVTPIGAFAVAAALVIVSLLM